MAFNQNEKMTELFFILVECNTIFMWSAKSVATTDSQQLCHFLLFYIEKFVENENGLNKGFAGCVKLN